MAVLYGIQDLEESSLDKIIIANILALLSDVREQITFRAVLNYDISAVGSVHDLDQRDYIGMSTGLVMELDFPLLELSLARLKAKLVECLHGIWNVGLDIHGCVNNAVCSYTKNTGKL
jgi:hypothetical protein